MSGEPPVKRKRRRPAGKVVPRGGAPQAQLFPGDTIGQSISMQVPGENEAWVRTEATTTVQEGESYLDAGRRLRAVVEETMDDNIGSLLDG